MRFIFGVLVLVPGLAMAGKLEREFVKTEVNPAVEEASGAYKKACGCDLKIVVKTDSFLTVDETRQARNIAKGITDGVVGYCTDAESKKALCKMKTLDIQKDKETKFSFSGSTGKALTDGNSYVSFDMMTQQLDK